METRKIAVACFIGGALCCAVALMFAPIYWWFGLIAGIAGGYISYEFREVRKAITIALRAAGQGSVYAWDGVIASAKTWLSRPHPFFYTGAVLALPFAFLNGPYLFEMAKGPGTSVLSVILLLVAYGEVAMILGAPFSIFAFIGARVVERCYWTPTMENSGGDQQKWFAELREKGYREVSLTYTNAARWTAKGVLATMKFFVWTLCKYLAIAAWATICFLGRFAWHLFKLIHSEKRVLCAIDGTLGGAVSYIWFASSAMTFPEQAVFAIFGGLLGAAFGVANWEIVSKRILHVAYASN